MAKAYCILIETIHDPATMERYTAQATAPLRASGATILAVDGGEVREGAWPGTRTVLVEFESRELLDQWYYSDEYQEAIAIRQSAADCHVIVLDGRA